MHFMERNILNPSDKMTGTNANGNEVYLIARASYDVAGMSRQQLQTCQSKQLLFQRESHPTVKHIMCTISSCFPFLLAFIALDF